jgi:hypothetical protein
MPDWDRIVAEKLPRLKLQETREAEIRDELAGHFAEMHVDFLASTHSEEEAMRLALEEIGDWGALARRIRITERLGMLNLRVRTLWLPGLMGLAAAALSSVALSMVLHRMPDGGRAFIKAMNDSGLGMAFFGISTVPAGFVSAGIAWYAGASGIRRVCAALFPLAVSMLALTVVVFWMRAPLHVLLAAQLRIIPFIGPGLLVGGLPFFFRRQRLSFFPCRWLSS